MSAPTRLPLMGATLPIPLTQPERSTPRPLAPPPPVSAPAPSRWPFAHVALILGLWLAIFAAALAKPPLLDDADATHAQAVQAMLRTGDFTTLHVDGVRYLEKAPLPYWISALSLRLFASAGPAAGARAAFAIHLPLALTVLGLALLGYAWSRRAFDEPVDAPVANPTATPTAIILHNRTALYTAIFILTSAGVFLFTRIFIPDALLSLLLAFTLYAMLRALEPATTRGGPAPTLSLPKGPDSRTRVRRMSSSRLYPGAPSSSLRRRGAGAWPYAMWTALALAVLTKGLVALVFFFGAALALLATTGERRSLRQSLRRLRPLTGILLLLAIAAPWHILAGLRNTGGAKGHGFFWFYFVNEHFLRFLGRRIPRDYNKLPGYLYWSLHLVWLFPWSLFAPAAILYAWRNRKLLRRQQAAQGFRPESPIPSRKTGLSRCDTPSFTHRTVLVLSLFSALVLVFFSLSTNQEYYTFPVYLPLLMLLAAALAAIERTSGQPRNLGAPGPSHLGTWAGGASNIPGAPPSRPLPGAKVGGSHPGSPQPQPFHRALTFAFAALTVLGLAIATALAYGLWTARHLPFVADIGSLLAHRDVGGYTLAMSHFFDLTGPSFAALRLPAALAALAFFFGPAFAWFLYARNAHPRQLRTGIARPRTPRTTSLLFAPLLLLALTSAVFLIAAHIALERFAPMLSSETFAATIQSLERSGRISSNTQVLIYGDQAFGSSIPFYLAQGYRAPSYPQAAGNPLQRPAYLAPHAATPRVYLVDGRTTSMLFGSTFPDAPPIFLTHQQLLAQWGHGPRKLLFVPLEQRDTVDRLLGPHQFLLQETSGKALLTDRPLNPAP